MYVIRTGVPPSKPKTSFGARETEKETAQGRLLSLRLGFSWQLQLREHQEERRALDVVAVEEEGWFSPPMRFNVPDKPPARPN